mmetsp:Transcript_15304/g.44242  ORF Transcript_15304/g.44242 Transcript_15304/m.44242 type:complete len:265 (+) Transcript_15304:3977-4771(+)
MPEVSGVVISSACLALIVQRRTMRRSRLVVAVVAFLVSAATLAVLLVVLPMPRVPLQSPLLLRRTTQPCSPSFSRRTTRPRLATLTRSLPNTRARKRSFSAPWHTSMVSPIPSRTMLDQNQPHRLLQEVFPLLPYLCRRYRPRQVASQRCQRPPSALLLWRLLLLSLPTNQLRPRRRERRLQVDLVHLTIAPFSTTSTSSTNRHTLPRWTSSWSSTMAASPRCSQSLQRSTTFLTHCPQICKGARSHPRLRPGRVAVLLYLEAA